MYGLNKPTVLSIHHFKEMLFTQTLKIGTMERLELQVFLPCVFSRRKCLSQR